MMQTEEKMFVWKGGKASEDEIQRGLFGRGGCFFFFFFFDGFNY